MRSKIIRNRRRLPPLATDPRIQALCGVAIISFSAIFVRLAGVAPVTASFFRSLYALPLLWWIYRQVDQGGRSRRFRLTTMAVGGLLALDLTFWHWAIDLIGAGLSTVLGNTQVVFVGLASWLLLGEKPTRKAFFAVPLVFLGAVLVSGLGRADAYGSDPLLGTTLGVLTGVTYASFLLLFRAAGRKAKSSVGPLLDVTLGAALGSLALGWLDPGFSLIPSWPAHGWLAALALVSQVLGWLLLSSALPRLPALEVSVLMLIQPMATVVWAWLLFAENLSAVQWGGVALVLGGVLGMSLTGDLVEERKAATG